MMSIAIAVVQDFRLEPKAFIYFLQLGKCSEFDIGRRDTIEVIFSCYSQSHVIQFTPTFYVAKVDFVCSASTPDSTIRLYGVRS
jgi:hypothetical protein